MKKGPQLFRITMSALKAPGPGAAGDSASGVDAPVAGTTPEGAVPPHKKVTCEAQPTGAAGWWAALVSLWQEPDRSLLTASPSLVQDQGAPRSWLWPAMPPGEVLERSPWGPALPVQWRTNRGGASSPPQRVAGTTGKAATPTGIGDYRSWGPTRCVPPLSATSQRPLPHPSSLLGGYGVAGLSSSSVSSDASPVLTRSHNAADLECQDGEGAQLRLQTPVEASAWLTAHPPQQTEDRPPCGRMALGPQTGKKRNKQNLLLASTVRRWDSLPPSKPRPPATLPDAYQE